MPGFQSFTGSLTSADNQTIYVTSIAPLLVLCASRRVLTAERPGRAPTGFPMSPQTE